MPGNVEYSSISEGDELPAGLARAFTRIESYPALVAEYADGSCQQTSLGATCGHRWRQTRRLTAAALIVLRNFYVDHAGPAKPFFFTDWFDGETYPVRFENAWAETWNLSRSDLSFELVEIA